jgi:hypothetical protein
MRGNGWVRLGLAVLAVVALLAAAGCIIRPRGAVRVDATAGPPVSAGGQVGNGTISYPGQRIRYPLGISYARTVQIYVNGYGLDPTVSVYDPYGNRIGFNDDGGGGLDSALVLTLAPGNYVVEVAGYSSSTGPFTLTIN